MMIHPTWWNAKAWVFPALVLPALLTNIQDLKPTGFSLMILGEADAFLDF